MSQLSLFVWNAELSDKGPVYVVQADTEKHGFRLDGELEEVPMTLRLLAEWNRSLDAVYAYARTLPESKTRGHLMTVLSMASDFLCNTCYDYKVDPFILDYWDGTSDNTIVTPFVPDVPE